MVARLWSSSHLSCGERLLLSCDGNAGNSFLTTQGKDSSSRARRRIGTPMDVGGTLVLPLEWRRLCRVNFRVATRVGTTIWKFQRLGVISLETPHRKWASTPLEGRTSWIFSSFGRCSRLTTGTSETGSGGLRKGQSPCELLGGFSEFLSRRCRGLRSCVEWVPEPEVPLQC